MPTEGFDAIPPEIRGGVLAIGNFDGVHRGHARLIAALRDLAARRRKHPVAVTFDPHPATLLRPQSAPTPLTEIADRRELLERCGVRHLHVLRATPELLELSAEEFWRRVLREQFALAGLVEGHDFTFGKGRSGNVDRLREWTGQAGIPFTVVDAVSQDGGVVSSTRIRRLIQSGELDAAAALLGRPHVAAGTVATGDRRGRTIGFPTANLASVQTLLPPDGVYAGWARFDGRVFPAACNIGPNPTFGVNARKIEVHLLDADVDLYGRRLGFSFIARLRDVRRFAGADDLVAQLKSDVGAARELLSRLAPPTPAREAARELLAVIREWFALLYGTDESGYAGEPARLELEGGALRAEWRQATPLLPSDRSELFGRLEPRLRQTFPEVTRVELEMTPDPNDRRPISTV